MEPISENDCAQYYETMYNDLLRIYNQREKESKFDICERDKARTRCEKLEAESKRFHEQNEALFKQNEDFRKQIDSVETGIDCKAENKDLLWWNNELHQQAKEQEERMEKLDADNTQLRKEIELLKESTRKHESNLTIEIAFLQGQVEAYKYMVEH